MDTTSNHTQASRCCIITCKPWCVQVDAVAHQEVLQEPAHKLNHVSSHAHWHCKMPCAHCAQTSNSIHHIQMGTTAQQACKHVLRYATHQTYHMEAGQQHTNVQQHVRCVSCAKIATYERSPSHDYAKTHSVSGANTCSKTSYLMHAPTHTLHTCGGLTYHIETYVKEAHADLHMCSHAPFLPTDILYTVVPSCHQQTLLSWTADSSSAALVHQIANIGWAYLST